MEKSGWENQITRMGKIGMGKPRMGKSEWENGSVWGLCMVVCTLSLKSR